MALSSLRERVGYFAACGFRGIHDFGTAPFFFLESTFCDIAHGPEA